MAKIKDLKNINKFGYKKLALWGMIGSVTLLVYSILSTILISAINWSVSDEIFRFIGLGLGIAYAILGVFALVKVIQVQKGKYWGVFLVGAIFAILTPLGYFPGAGIALSLIAGLAFLIFTLLEK